MNKREFEQTLRDKAYWEALSDLIPGWRLLGWTYCQHATYTTPGLYGETTIHMDGTQRDSLVDVILGQREM